MQNKLQELTEKLYNEGLSKGKTDGEAFLQKAKEDAEAIIAQAKKEAEQIIAKANKDAEDLKNKVSSDIALSSKKAIAATRQSIESLIITKATTSNVSTALSSEDFVKELIKASVAAFSKDTSLEITLSETAKSSLVDYINTEIAAAFNNGVEIKYNKKIAAGFTVGSKDEAYFVNFTDEAFEAIISEYLRPATKKILFG